MYSALSYIFPNNLFISTVKTTKVLLIIMYQQDHEHITE